MVASEEIRDSTQQHLGLETASAMQNGVLVLRIPAALAAVVDEHKIHAVLNVPFHETHGHCAPPYHTKARNFLRAFVERNDLTQVLAKPLRSVLEFEAPSVIDERVDTRLRTFTGWNGRKLCLIARNGYTSVGKNWGHRWREDMPVGRRREGEEAREFMRLMLQHDPDWVFIAMEDQMFQGDDTLRSQELNCVSYAALFGTPETATVPFGLVMKALAKRADLAVGVPTGPYHFCMAKPDLPTIGIWLEHLPCWYDEPKDNSRHIIGHYLEECGALARVGSNLDIPGLSFNYRKLQTRIVPGEAVFDAARDLLG
jgi:hypothetical protein